MSSLEQRAVNRVVTDARAAGVEIPAEILNLQARLEHGTGEPWQRYLELHPDFTEDQHPACCYGVVIYGPTRCTCWVPVFEDDQASPCPPTSDGEIDTRSQRCSDCAFLRNSKERSNALTEEELLELPLRGDRFWCHDGMRRPIAWRHPRLGEIPGDPDDWQPPIRDGIPYRADGQVALMCAGWAARHETVVA